MIKQSNYKRATFLIVSSTLSFTLMSALIKYLDNYPLPQILFFRAATALLVMLYLLKLTNNLHSLKTNRVKLHLIRSIFGLSAMALMFFSIRSIPFATASTLFHSNTLFLVIASAIILGEKFYRERMAIALVGFLGVVIMLNPTAPDLSLGAAAALISALLAAFALICVRSLSQTEHTFSIVFYFMLFSSSVTGCFAYFYWVNPHSILDLFLLLSIGVSGALGQIFMVGACKVAEPSFVGPLQYIELLWVVAIGYLFWGEVPSWWMILGAVIVVASQIHLQRHGAKVQTLKTETQSIHQN